ncbi:hypothetical protein F5H01DRAFT_369412 [Linnemannia elongata]|nr:hypothetical protein F5H01DRAFT_369412 [Linnemannia elongata]
MKFVNTIVFILFSTLALQSGIDGLVLDNGLYKITNVASRSTVRSYNPRTQVYIASTREAPGPFEMWKGQYDNVHHGYILHNVGLSLGAAVHKVGDGEPVSTAGTPTVFQIEPAGDSSFAIKVPDVDLLWTAEPPVIPHGDIALKPANGRANIEGSKSNVAMNAWLP